MSSDPTVTAEPETIEPETIEPDTSEQAGLTPAQMAERTGVSIDTLRYYEREGLISGIARAGSGHRRYSQHDVMWVAVLRCLRETGMTMEQLRHYCDLGAQGDHTAPERKAILLEHRAEVERQIIERQEALGHIDHKLSFYTDNPTPAPRPVTLNGAGAGIDKETT